MEAIWHNKEIRFDCPNNQLKLHKGERVIDTITNIEDTKGNPDENGTFKFTNLRALWYSDTNNYINLSIGLDTITGCEAKANYSGTYGNTQALTLRCKFNSSKFEFIFTARSKDAVRMGTLFQNIRQSYESTRLYRDLRMRGAIVQDKDLILLPQESIINKYNNVLNLTSDQSDVGTFILTNIRIVWFHTTSDNFNASIPYIQIKSIKKKDSKSGPAVVVETFPQPGETKGYPIGFQTDELGQLQKELTQLHKLYYNNPFFGLDGVEEVIGSTKDDSSSRRVDEDMEVIDKDYNDRNNNIMNYLTAAAGKEVIIFTHLELS